MKNWGTSCFTFFSCPAMFEEDGHFDLDQVAARITEKMVRRHPHVFGDDSAASAEEVKLKWRDIKDGKKIPCRPGVSSRLDSSQFTGADARLPDIGTRGRHRF